jgi:hypothetical protein
MSLSSKIQNDFQNIINLFNLSLNKITISTTKILIFIGIIVFFCVIIQLQYDNAVLSQYIGKKEEETQIEKFTNKQQDIKPVNISITYAIPNDSKNVFANDKEKSSSHNYLQLMNELNIMARSLTNETLYDFYQNCFQDITPLEQKYTTKSVQVLLNNLNSQNKTSYVTYLKHWIEKSKLAKSISALEGNMPHTHDNYIIFPSEWYRNPNESTLIHELTHIHQRFKTNEFDILYESFGFEYYNKGVHTIKGLEQAVDMSRHNPDGYDLNWIWMPRKYYKLSDNRSYFFITAKYPSIENPSLTNVEYVAYPLERDNQGVYYKLTSEQPIPISKLDIFQKHFGITNNHYHPNEIAAQYAEYYLEDSLANKNDIEKTKRKSSGYSSYLLWMNKHLGYPDIFDRKR